MSAGRRILVLGAYGLAGRAIVERLAAKTGWPLTAAGRRADKLAALRAETGGDRVDTLVLDAADTAALRAACTEAAFVINAVGPFARGGAAIARAVVECGVPYLDCANEQEHYRNLAPLDAVAREHGVPLITAAGAIPGLSTLVITRLLERTPGADAVDYCWAQFRHARAESGLASMMGGLLEAAGRPVAVRDGRPVPVVMGRSVRDVDLPEPFGRRRLLEVPTIEALTLPERFPLRELHAWFYLGNLPLWLLDGVRLLDPGRRRWAYRLIEAVMRRINDAETRNAVAAGIGPEALLSVRACGPQAEAAADILFRDGAVATACLPAHLAGCWLRGELPETGLLTPAGLPVCGDLAAITADALIPPLPDILSHPARGCFAPRERI